MADGYNSESIQVLNDIEHIRKRKGMYIGEGENPQQLISEIIDNAIDEVQGGFSKKYTVTIDTKENRYTVRDFGRGIPHGKKEVGGEKKEILEVLCTKSNSGGKFDNKSYSISSGLNGLGLTITNALSKELIISSYRNGKCVTLIAHNGNIENIKHTTTKEKDGTYVSFIPNEKEFISPYIPLDYIKSKCDISTALGFNAELFVDGNKQNLNTNIFDLIPDDNKISKYCDIKLKDIIATNGEIMKTAIQYTSETNEKYYGYTNLLYNSLGGTHITALSKTISDTWTDYIKQNKIKTVVELKPSDFLIGIRAVCAVFISEPMFTSQTKERLKVDKHYFDDMMVKFKKIFTKYLSENKSLSLSLIKRFEEYRLAQNKLLARKEISSFIKVNNDNPNNIRRRAVVPKLIDCTSVNRENTELFIVEGDSASGPAARARNKELQAVLPLRGKILNVTNKNPKDAVKSQEVCNIVNAIGCGIGTQCDSSKSRYEKIIINADADPDGANIVCLVLSVFINLLPDIVKDGRLFIAVPPLYGWKDKKGYHYSNNKDNIPQGIKFTRYKGLGEMDDDEFGYCCMNPKSRQLVQVEYPADLDLFNHILGTSAGKSELLTDLGIVRNMR